ncbi:MAG: type I restriction endonuclease subunit R, partial [Burkholderiales bacterium]|nr:type I restriction endonuclease subunit R [Burkholderiales bacterium]
ERKELREIVAKMNDLFAGEVSEADFIGAVTTWKGHLMANESLAEQAKNNSEEQFSMGDFKEAFMDVVIDAKDAQNSIADQLLKDERVFGVMQRLVSRMVWQQFQKGAQA